MTSLGKLFAAPDLTAATFRELTQISNKKASNPMEKLTKAKCRKFLKRFNLILVKKCKLKQ